MAYFNGGLHGWNDATGYHRAEPWSMAGSVCALKEAARQLAASKGLSQHPHTSPARRAR